MFDDTVNALFSFDGINKRLYLYTQASGLSSYRLDGSDVTTITVANVEFFAVDGRNNLIYYHHVLNERIWVYNITSEENSAVTGLSDVESAKDMEIDVING
jgi:hypothetical protein